MLSITFAIASFAALWSASTVTAYPLPGEPAPNVALFNLPAAITPPAGQVLEAVYLGYGTQNYTCNATSLTYSTSGTAEAKLIEISQYYTGTTAPTVLPIIKDLKVVGSHYFVPNPLVAGAIAPKFLNTCEKEFFIGTRNASVANALPSYSVAAVLLKNIEFEGQGGSLAEWVVRTDIIGGVVPAALNTCKAGDAITIPYKAHYLFFKS